VEQQSNFQRISLSGDGERWLANTRVDTIVLTKNSGKVLKECLASVYENVPVNTLIVVDGYSTDSTLDIVEEFQARYGNVVLIQDRGTRGSARQRAIECVKSNWFMFVDSDVVLCKEWFKKAGRYIQDDVGAIWGIDIPGAVRGRLMTKVLQWMEARVFDIRGGCHDILIRHDAVKGIKIPSHLHTLEDAYIKEWIASRKYKVVVSYGSYCTHYKTMKDLFSKENRSSTISEFKNMRFMRERLVFSAFFALVWFLQQIRSRNGAEYLT
jgi:glycosyltransferase involved in cell wall biosynthesis